MSKLAIAEAMIAAYNAQDVDLYVSYMTDDACEANYRGAVVRDAGGGVSRAGRLEAAAPAEPRRNRELIEPDEPKKKRRDPAARGGSREIGTA